MNSTERNRKVYKGMKNKAIKAVLEAMREKADEALTDLKIIQMKCLDY